MGESIGLTGFRQHPRCLGLIGCEEICRDLAMLFTQTHLSEQFEVELSLATQMHWPIEHY